MHPQDPCPPPWNKAEDQAAERRKKLSDWPQWRSFKNGLQGVEKGPQRRADISVRLSLQEAGWKPHSPLLGDSGLESPLSFEKPAVVVVMENGLTPVTTRHHENWETRQIAHA